MQKDAFRPSSKSDYDSDAFEELSEALEECYEAVPMAEPASWRDLDPQRRQRKGRRVWHRITRR